MTETTPSDWLRAARAVTRKLTAENPDWSLTCALSLNSPSLVLRAANRVEGRLITTFLPYERIIGAASGERADPAALAALLEGTLTSLIAGRA